MLVLSRTPGESVHIGDDVVLQITEVRGDKVRLGFEAPRSVPIHRGEVYHAIKRERRSVRGSTEEQLYGIVFLHGNHRNKRVVLIKSVSQRSAESRAKERVMEVLGIYCISETICFGDANSDNTQIAQSWAFEQWVGGAELVRATECTQATA